MPKVAPIDQRKADHIKINLEQGVRSALTTGLENYHFTHEALPELDLNRIDTTLSLFGKQLAAPILISSMTGGTAEAEIINLRLAGAAHGHLRRLSPAPPPAAARAPVHRPAEGDLRAAGVLGTALIADHPEKCVGTAEAQRPQRENEGAAETQAFVLLMIRTRYAILGTALFPMLAR